MAKVWDAAKQAQKWQTNFGGSGATWMAGINALTTSPTQLAATPQAEAAYLAGVQNSITSGRRAAGLNKVDVGTFKNRCQLKQANLATGASAGKTKMQLALQNLQPVWQAQAAASQAVGGPRGTNSAAKWTASFAAQMAGVGKQAK